jgi:hypothetical protein
VEATAKSGTPATPMKATSTIPSPQSAKDTPVTASPKSAGPTRRIVLGSAWSSPTQSGELTRKDLATIFSGRGKASESTEGDSSLLVYPDIPFLTPVPEAKKRLRLEGVNSSKTKIVCPGMPLDSFWSHAFDGVFVGGFDRLCLITDGADQVISVLLMPQRNVRVLSIL